MDLSILTSPIGLASAFGIQSLSILILNLPKKIGYVLYEFIMGYVGIIYITLAMIGWQR